MRTFIALVVLGLAACGGDDDGGNLSGNVTLREVCEAFADVTCDKVQECEPPAPENCTSIFVSACCEGGSCNEVVGNGDAIDACLDDFRDLTCAELESEEIDLASCGL
jgi:hypothetical protein